MTDTKRGIVGMLLILTFGLVLILICVMVSDIPKREIQEFPKYNIYYEYNVYINSDGSPNDTLPIDTILKQH
jgi:hypothetical protein